MLYRMEMSWSWSERICIKEDKREMNVFGYFSQNVSELLGRSYIYWFSLGEIKSTHCRAGIADGLKGRKKGIKVKKCYI